MRMHPQQQLQDLKIRRLSCRAPLAGGMNESLQSELAQIPEQQQMLPHPYCNNSPTKSKSRNEATNHPLPNTKASHISTIFISLNPIRSFIVAHIYRLTIPRYFSILW